MKTLFRQPITRKPRVDPNQFALFGPTIVERRAVEVEKKVTGGLKVELAKAAAECSDSIYRALVETRWKKPVSYLPAKWYGINKNMDERQRWPTRNAIMEILHFAKIAGKEERGEEIRAAGSKLLFYAKAIIILETLDLQLEKKDYEAAHKTIETLAGMRKHSPGNGVYQRIKVYAHSPAEEAQKPN